MAGTGFHIPTGHRVPIAIMGILALLTGALLASTSVGIARGVAAGIIVALAAIGFMGFARTPRHVIGRGVISLGVIFILIPLTSLGLLAGAAAESAVLGAAGVDPTYDLAWIVTFAFGFAGFGLVVGLILLAVGGMIIGRANKAAPSP